MINVLVLIAFVATVPSATLAQDQQVWVNVLINGEAVMGFVPAEDRAGQDKRGVCSEVTDRGAKTKDGASIRALKFTGWKENDGYRVLVFAIVSGEDATSTQRRCDEGSGSKRVAFDDVRVKSGDQITLAKMKDAGMTPWVIRVGPQDPALRDKN